MISSPFKFLDSYTIRDKDIFFGRDHEISELYRRVFESKILLVYGISGTGKSSLINCGLASRFDDSDWLPVNIRRGRNIIDSLDEAFNQQAIRPFKKRVSVTEKLQSIYLDHFKPVYLIFDQFEELFIFGSQDEKTGFIKLIKEITESETQCRIIFIIREEFLAGMTEFEFRLPDVFTNRFRVEKMKRTNAISAIEGPCKVHHIETEPGFSEELIDKLCPSGNEIELTFLQVYLDRIFRIAIAEKREESNLRFSKELLTRAGSVSDLLGQFLEEQIYKFEDPDSGMAILKSFVSVQGTKKQMTEKDILDSIGTFGTEIKEPDLIKYLEKFVDLRILRERDDAGHYELRHDALAAKIYEKFTSQERELAEIKLFVENAFLTFNARKTYLSREDLEYIAPYEKRLFLPPALSHFIKLSKDKFIAQQKALRRMTSIVSLVFLILIGFGVRYYINQKGTSKTKELITVALIQEKVDPLASIKTAYDTWQRDTISTVLQGIIFNSFYYLLNKEIASGSALIPREMLPIPIPVNDSICSLQTDKSCTTLFGWTISNEVFFWNLNSQEVKTFKVSDQILVIVASDSAKYFAVVYQNSNCEVYNNQGESVFSFKTTINHLMNNRLVRFFPEGKYFLAAVNGNNVQVYDSAGVCLYNLSGHKKSVNSLDISPDGRFIATASSDNNLIVWNLNHKILQFSPYIRINAHKDTVWSCEFNSTGKYILTSSADSLLKIFDFNGREWSGSAYFATNLKHGGVYWFLRDQMFSDTSLKYLDSYKFKVCNASFEAGDRAVVASNYSYDISTTRIREGIFRSQVMYFGTSYMFLDLPDPYFKKSERQYFSKQPEYLTSANISSDRLFFALKLSKQEFIITRSDGYVLTKIKGDYPEFSKSGKYLYYLESKSIRVFPLNAGEIFSMVIEKKLFGDYNKNEGPWKII
jgi:WD40 repeat protein